MPRAFLIAHWTRPGRSTRAADISLNPPAADFYRIFLSSLEGMEWVPQALVIGPQGVLDVVNMTGKLIKEYAGLRKVGEQVHLQWVIYFPWVPHEGKFRGELIYSIRQL